MTWVEEEASPRNECKFTVEEFREVNAFNLSGLKVPINGLVIPPEVF